MSIRCKAAVAWEANSPIDITDVDIGPPKAGEVRIRVVANALCHTDMYTLEGHDPEGLFPVVLGHEATGIVESIGEGVTSVVVGDHVIPCYTPECREADCKFCASDKTNLCPKIRTTQGKGVMPDGTSRISKNGKPIYHFMGCSTFAEYAVIPEIAIAKIPKAADLDKVCLLGCGVSTGWGAVINNACMEPEGTVAVFGLGTLGLAVIQASKMVGAKRIVAVDINEHKFALAKDMGATDTFNSLNKNAAEELLKLEKWGFDYTFDCTGNVGVMRVALEVAHRGWGKSIVVGVAAAGKEISTRPFQLVTGRRWLGTAFGGWKSRSDVPQLVKKVMTHEVDISMYITHKFDGLENVPKSIEALHGGNCLRAVVRIHPDYKCEAPKVEMKANNKLFGGRMQRICHYSETCNSNMRFSIFLPKTKSRSTIKTPLIIYLSGLTCTDDNARSKSYFASAAAKYGVAVLFPDTSPRSVPTPVCNVTGTFYVGEGAGFYINATTEGWRDHYNMYDYVTKELPNLVDTLFNVDLSRMSIMGHSMGGHGALMLHFKNPGMFKSVSALAPLCSVTNILWGKEAFAEYLGSSEAGKHYDACELLRSTEDRLPILIDVGTNDEFADSLYIDEFQAVANAVGHTGIKIRKQQGYDHSYFFISSFMQDHIEYHASALGVKKRV